MAATDESGTSRTPRMSRQARRAQLFDAALEVFASAGYHAAAMDDIAERAGVSKPVLYQHFPGKLELYLALLDDAYEQFQDTVIGALGRGATDPERIEATMAAYFDFVARERSPFRLVFESDLSNDPAVRERICALEEALAAAVAPLVVAGTDYDADEARLLATALVGMAQQSARYWQDHPAGIPCGRAARMVASLANLGVRDLPRRYAEGPEYITGRRPS